MMPTRGYLLLTLLMVLVVSVVFGQTPNQLVDTTTPQNIFNKHFDNSNTFEGITVGAGEGTVTIEDSGGVDVSDAINHALRIVDVSPPPLQQPMPIVNGNSPGQAVVTNTAPAADAYGLAARLIPDANNPIGISGNVTGGVAHDAPTTGNPVLIGCRSNSSAPPNVADNDVSYLRCTQGGDLIITGATGGTSQSDNSAVTSITGIGMQYDTTPNAITDGNVGLPRMDSTRRTIVVCEVGCGGSSLSGDVPHDGVDSGNPVKIGGQARTSLPTAVANADRTNAIFDKFGRLITLPQGPRDLVVQGTVTLTTTTETTILAAVASTFLDLTFMRCTNGSSTKVRVDIRDATGGTIRDSAWLGADAGGFNGPLPIPFTQTTSNSNWTVQLSGAVTDVRCTFQAVKNL